MCGIKAGILSTVNADIRAFIERQQELMFNERDFQMQLAVYLRQSGHYDDVDVEYYIPNRVAVEAGYEWSSELRLDIVVSSGGVYAVVELKYPTRRIVTDIRRFGTVLSGVEIVKNHGAQDIVSYNFWKDVRRIEIIRRLFPQSVAGGVAVMLTNEPFYTRARARALSATHSQPAADAAASTACSTGAATQAPPKVYPDSRSTAHTQLTGTKRLLTAINFITH